MKKKLVALLLVAVSMIGLTAITSQAASTKGTLNIKVYDEDSEAGIKGVEFTIYDTAGKEVKTIKSNKNGVAKTKNLPLGNYTVKETAVPDKYEADPTPINFSITGNWSFVKLECANKIVEKKVERIDTELILDIKDVDGRKKLSPMYGSKQVKDLGTLKFKITDSQGKEFTTESNIDGGFDDLENIAVGEATIEQTNKVNGLKQLKKTKIDVQKIEYGNYILVPIELEQSPLHVTLIDEETGEPLKDVSFNLKDSFDFVYYSKTDSTGTAIFESVTTGNSLLLQSSTIEGYGTISPTDVKIDFKDQNNLTIKTKRGANKLGTLIFGDNLIYQLFDNKSFENYTQELDVEEIQELVTLVDKNGEKINPMSNTSPLLVFENLPEGEYKLIIQPLIDYLNNTNQLSRDGLLVQKGRIGLEGLGFYDEVNILLNQVINEIKVNVTSNNQYIISYLRNRLPSN